MGVNQGLQTKVFNFGGDYRRCFWLCDITNPSMTSAPTEGSCPFSAMFREGERKLKGLGPVRRRVNTTSPCPQAVLGPPSHDSIHSFNKLLGSWASGAFPPYAGG